MSILATQKSRAHKRIQRLFVQNDLESGMIISLDNNQFAYLAKVSHKKTGDEVILFNGFDGAWLAKIVAVDRKSVNLECIECLRPQPQSCDIWYGFAPLKNARLDYMLQKATEMGASSLQPVITKYTRHSPLNFERMQANVIEAVEQCEILNIPNLCQVIQLEKLLADWKQEHGDRLLIFADEAAPNISPIAALKSISGTPVGLLVGPEAGFSISERRQLLACSFVIPISLGPRVLRADTAAVAALAIIQSTIGEH